MTGVASALAVARTMWLTASAEPIGLGVIVTDTQRAKQQLYRAREQLATQQPGLDLSGFTIRTSPDNPACELWLVRTARQASEAQPDARSPSVPGPQDGHQPLAG